MDKLKILFLAADPCDSSRLRLGQELRDIHDNLQRSKYRENFLLESRESVRPGDITQSIFDVEPQIIHFSGHGMETGELCFENIQGKTQPVQPDALANLFELVVGQVDCVVLNACYSEIQARAIAKHIPFVIGMNQAIGDKAAITFAIGFYKALGAGRSFEDAYKFACVELQLESIPEHLTPVIQYGPQREHFSTSAQTLAEYIYLDHKRIQSYVEQVDVSGSRVPNWVPGTISRGSTPQSTHESISTILNHLEKTGQLSHSRPRCKGWNGELFVLEKLEAQKAILPIRPNEIVSSLREISVWISDPALEDYKKEPYWASGALLYLIESYWKADAERYGTTMSGLSALRCIVGDMVNAELLPESSRDNIGWPRQDRRSPREILKTLGAVIQPKRQIQTLYRYRYISDEHFFTDTDGAHRSYDVYGYPIFIRAV
ncbi:MAG: CHAT domain-containing protein [Leptolyngbya sp. SIO1D8]|nr:CHAT domain-containing protein [Leptolyngbya sp. SIO1D8]